MAEAGALALPLAEQLRRRPRPGVLLIRVLAWGATGIALSVLTGIILYILVRGLRGITWQLVSTSPSYLNKTYGILPILINTGYIVLLGLLFAIPIGVGAALYLTEYAKQGRFVAAIRYAVEILAGIPSIVYGLFGALFFVSVLHFGYSILSGALTLAIIVLPVMIRTTEESLRAVDESYREAALSLGAGKLHIIRTILLPGAMPGILTAVILSMGRMVGESAALLCTSGMGFAMPGSNWAAHIMDSGATLTVQLYLCFTERPAGMTDETPFAIAAILMLLVLLMNLLITRIAALFNPNSVRRRALRLPKRAGRAGRQKG